MIEVSFRWEGLEELEAAFAALPAAVHQKVLDRALRKVAAPMVEFARRLAPRSAFPRVSAGRMKALVRWPHMADSIQVRSGGLGPEGVTVWIGPDPGHYWGWFIEFGHDVVVYRGTEEVNRRYAHWQGAAGSAVRALVSTFKLKSRKRRIVTGHVSPRPFIRPAFDAYQDQIMQNLGAEIWESLLQVSAGLARKAMRARAEAYRSTFTGAA